MTDQLPQAPEPGAESGVDQVEHPETPEHPVVNLYRAHDEEPAVRSPERPPEPRAPDPDAGEPEPLNEAHERVLGEAVQARNLLDDRERELEAIRERELAAARSAREAAEAREAELLTIRERELAHARRILDAADARKRDQTERQRARRRQQVMYVGIGLAVAVALAALGGVALTLGEELGISYRSRVGLALALFVSAFLGSVSVLLLPRLLDARRDERDVEARARESAHQALEDLADATDLAALIRANRKQMEAYDVLARAQAKSAFRNSQVAMAAGLSVLLLGSVVAINADDTASKITTASLTAIGGVLSGFIARTFLQTYSRALRQLNFYFQQPLINSYLLSAQRLVREMSVSRRDAALSHVVRNVMAVVVRLPWTGIEVERESTGEPVVKDAAGAADDREDAAGG